MSDEAVFTGEEIDRTVRYLSALTQLATNDIMWVPNYTVYRKWLTGHRLWWIEQIEQQARDGKDTVGARLVAHVVTMRLET